MFCLISQLSLITVHPYENQNAYQFIRNFVVMGLQNTRIEKSFSGTYGASSCRKSFKTTHWSLILLAGARQSPKSDEALGELCRDYWYPLYYYVRRKGYSPEDAKDAIQNFFLKLSTKFFFKSAKPEKGSFRGFLLMVLKRFLSSEWHSSRAIKRGGGQMLVPLNIDLTESRYQIEPEDSRSPDLLFDRQWAATLLEIVLKRLRLEYAGSGKEKLFDILQNSIGGGSDISHAAAAEKLGMTEGAMKVAAHRCRVRYRNLLREEIGKTVSCPDEIDGEIRHLFATFSE